MIDDTKKILDYGAIERDRKQIYSDQEYVRLCRLFSTYALVEPNKVKEKMFYHRYGNSYFPPYKFETTVDAQEFLDEWISVVMCRPIKTYEPEEKYEILRKKKDSVLIFEEEVKDIKSLQNDFPRDEVVERIATSPDCLRATSVNCAAHFSDECGLNIEFRYEEERSVSVNLCARLDNLIWRVLQAFSKSCQMSYHVDGVIEQRGGPVKMWQDLLSLVMYPTEYTKDQCLIDKDETYVRILEKKISKHTSSRDSFVFRLEKRGIMKSFSIEYLPDKFFLVGKEVYQFLNTMTHIYKEKNIKKEFELFSKRFKDLGYREYIEENVRKKDHSLQIEQEDFLIVGMEEIGQDIT